MEKKQRHFSVAYVIIATIMLFLIQSFLFAPHPENLAYSDFKVLLSKGKVSDLTVDKQTITGALATSGLEGAAPQGQARRAQAVRPGAAPLHHHAHR
jgi:cell division protease FtsH